MNSANTGLPIVEEELQVGKRRFETERVRVGTVTDSAKELVRQELTGEHLEVERVPIGSRRLTGADPSDPVVARPPHAFALAEPPALPDRDP